MTQKSKITVFNQKNANEAEASQKQLQGKQTQHVHIVSVTWPAWPADTQAAPGRTWGPGDGQSKPGADFLWKKGHYSWRWVYPVPIPSTEHSTQKKEPEHPP